MPTSNTQISPRRRRQSTNSLEGQTGRLQASQSTLHGDVGFRDRIHHFTWAWFTTTMSTGGIALVLSQAPHRFHGLTAIGEAVVILDLTLFLVFCAIISTRFFLFPKTFLASLTHPTESLFFATFWISIANIISNIQIYGRPRTGPWLDSTLRVLFWIYTACTFLVAVGQYFFLFTGKPFTLQSFTPAWILPVFPVMLCGTLAGALGSSQPAHHLLPILVAGLSFQGLGFLIAMFFYGIYLGRLMSQGLPSINTRPGMFIAVGPPSFTALALLSMSQAFSSISPSPTITNFSADPSLLPSIFRAIALATAVFLWATSLWFFSISSVSVLTGAITHGMSFHLTWWGLVFPNAGFTIATISIGKALESEGIQWVGTAMTIVVILVWFFVAIYHLKSVWKKKILWPGKDEDHDQ